MKSPEIPKNEKERLKELVRLQLMDTDREQDFDELTELAATICSVPVSLIGLIDQNRHWFKAKTGTSLESSPRDISFCGHAINGDELFIIENALDDERFYDNPLVNEDPNIRFYAGMPLKTENGFNIGTLCVIGFEPKVLDDNQKNALRILGKQASNLIALRDKKNELQHKNQRLQELNQINQRITEIISHDLKGPISSLNSYLSSSFVDSENAKEVLELFPIVKESINSLHSLVGNLMDWSKSISEVNITKVDLHGLTVETLSLIETVAADKNNKLTTDIDSKLSVLADVGMLGFILRNLLSNAMKFTEDGTIHVSSQVIDKNFVNILVQDSGVGISKDLLKRILQKDKKVTTKGTRKEKGTGLGLVLINEFLEIHHSGLKIESEENKGSTFSFVLPLSLE